MILHALSQVTWYEIVLAMLAASFIVAWAFGKLEARKEREAERWRLRQLRAERERKLVLLWADDPPGELFPTAADVFSRKVS